MQGGDSLAQLYLHDFTDDEEQKISKEILSLVEAIGDLEDLPEISATKEVLKKELGNEGSTSQERTGTTVATRKAAKIAERLIRLNGFEELFDSLSTEGNVDKNTLVVVIVILSSGELEDKLKELFALVAKKPSRERTKKREKMVATRQNLEDTGQLVLTCLVMMNLSMQFCNGPRFRLALFDPQIVMHVGKNHLERAISDVCDVHLLSSSFETPNPTSTKAHVDFDEFVQICLNVFYNIVESSSMKVLETPLRSRSDPVLRRFTDDGLDSTAEERLQRRISNATQDGGGGGDYGSQTNTPSGDPLMNVVETPVPLPEDLMHRKSLRDLAMEAADVAADEAREEEDAPENELPPTIAGLLQDFGLRLFFLSGVRFALALVFLAANGSLILVLVNRFDYTVEVALGFALVFDLGVALLSFYLASRLKKLEQNLALLNEGEGDDLGDLPEEIDSIMPGLGKLLPSSLGFLKGFGRGNKNKGKTPMKTPKAKKEKDGGSFISSISSFFGGGGDDKKKKKKGHDKNKSSKSSFTEMDFTPFKSQMSMQGRHSRQPSAELIL
ncbi:hypothetical protein HOP50_02g14160 [Chloropicon primus]|uniref:Uncharacterized protein n=1 Tax=Chloropicon primus TaxID=1764295 RepID=A0A5B8MHR2_9CHLO|nr:hypothetical protein A3770_02p14280 [Chloropicon primus]UPQ98118.1 hypothetical protein HOP50_02g14160 [Chloropicon primus]|eukprot:QDZ18910.1 hypothetical protein A3770_02p14280 [Chloropicon primus]